jgi:hypothetical protein
MSRMYIAFALLALGAGPLAAQARPAPAALPGVWRPVDARTGNAPGTASQPGLYVFTRQHYSIMRVTSNTPRPNPPATLNQATAAQLIAAWDPFTANAGTYQVNGSELVTRPIVSKAPSFMTTGSFIAYNWTVRGDTLTLLPLRTQQGPVTGGTTIRLVRVE